LNALSILRVEAYSDERCIIFDKTIEISRKRNGVRSRSLRALCRRDLFESQFYVDSFVSAQLFVDQVPDERHYVE